MRPHTIAQTPDGVEKPQKYQQAMAKFEIHGHPDVISELNANLPRDGTAPGQYLLEAVELRNEVTGPGRSKVVRDLDRWAEIEEELPKGQADPVEYLLECVRMRKRLEARDLVLTAPDTLGLTGDSPKRASGETE